MEKILKDRLEHKYGVFTPVQLSGGYTNAAFILEGTDPLVIVKISQTQNEDTTNEINCLRLMEKTGLSPKFYESFSCNESQITVIGYREGKNAQLIMDSGDLARIAEIYKLLGETLAKDIHSNKYSPEFEGIYKSTINGLDFCLPFVPKELQEKSRDMIKGIKDSQEEWVLTHGDFGIHNVLVNSKSELTVLDWEWGEWANPLTDISWVCWFTKLHYPEYASRLNHIFLEEYLKYRPVQMTSKKLTGYCVYKVWKVLKKVEYASSEVQAEWVRRLKWTLETEIFDRM
jgi:thiamine kinase-like enzyme